MEQITLYPIAYKGLKNGSYEFDFQVDDKLFEAYDRVEIKGGRCDAHIDLKRSETMLEMEVIHINFYTDATLLHPLSI